jgi:hypothetical protein
LIKSISEADEDNPDGKKKNDQVGLFFGNEFLHALSLSNFGFALDGT